MKRLYTIIIPFIFFLLTFVLFFHKELFFGHVFYCCDNFNLNVPNKLFLVHTALHYGQLPLINPYILSGTPFLADMNIGIANLTNILYAIVSPFQALTIQIMFAFTLAYWGMIILGIVLGVNPIAATISAIIFTYSGVLVDQIGNVAILSVISLLPFVCSSWVYLFKQPSIKRALIVIAISSIQLLSGHPQATFITQLFSILYAFCVPVIPLKRKIIYVFGIAVSIFLLTAFQILPFLEFASQSTRMMLSEQYSTFGSLKPILSIRFILPWIVGLRKEGTAIVGNGSIGGFIGFVPLVILILFKPKKNRLSIFLFTVLCISLLYSFGSYTPIHTIINTIIPGLSLFRMPQQMLFLFTLSFSLLSAIAVSAWTKRTVLKSILNPLGYFSLFLFMMTVSLFFLRYPILSFIQNTIHSIPPYYSATFLLPDGTIVLSVLYSTCINMTVVSILLGIIWLSVRICKNISTIQIVIAFCTAGEMCFVTLPTVRSELRSTVNTLLEIGNMTAKTVSVYTRDQYRMYVQPDAHGSPRTKTYGVNNEIEEELWQAQILRSDVNMYYQVPSVEGYASMIYLPYQKYFSDKKFEPTGISIDNPEEKIASDSGGVIIQKGADNQIVVTATKSPRPLLFFDVGILWNTRIQVVLQTPNELVVHLDTPEAGKLVYQLVNYPGWHVAVDGKLSQIVSYDSIFLSVNVPPGEHEIRFWYFPLSLKIGLGMSIASGIIFLSITVRAYTQSKRN